MINGVWEQGAPVTLSGSTESKGQNSQLKDRIHGKVTSVVAYPNSEPAMMHER